MPLTIKEFLAHGPATSREIQAATKLSQPVVSRQLQEMRDSVVRFRKGRKLIYVATCNAFGGNDKLPLSIVDAHGNTVLAAYIRPLVNGGFFSNANRNLTTMRITPPVRIGGGRCWQ